MDQVIFLESLLLSGISQCSAAIDGSEGLLFALLMAGFAGGATHCIGMCGPFVISQVQSRLEIIPVDKMSEFRRLTGGALVPYHLGRATTYMALGGIAALASQQLMKLDTLKWLAAALLALAALFFLGYALQNLGLNVFKGKPGRGEGALARAWG
ncbi:MAG: sulfite exporter TauE/SafE family protein, partial [Magnetovibrio sp.]|nr:sulfite exporter TauE/SafE family protein [Magnetovibrio sp.]